MFAMVEVASCRRREIRVICRDVDGPRDCHTEWNKLKREKQIPNYCCSVTQSCPTLCDPMDCSTPGLPVLHHLLEFAQVHVHCINDAVQPSDPLTPSSLSALSLFQHQGLFQWIICLHQMRLSGLISLLFKGLSGVFSSTRVWKHQLFGVLPYLRSSSQNHMWPLGRP